MPFLPPNQQRQSTEGTFKEKKRKLGKILVLELREILSREKAFVDMMVYQWSKKFGANWLRARYLFGQNAIFAVVLGA